ncbi:MAG: PorP/SprF family type IX secretion system membrane protein [Prevotellaceae bacterium]|jgi:type IX secretion system PorP/SprF family membrane protein|nr:PorP/SprF family type IX secretion system membrane protein [Prevotellaceae bacterium]
MKRLFIGILLCFTFVCRIFAQFDGQFSQYMHNFCIVNPAYTGGQDMMQVTIMQRTQWLGFKGAPIVSLLSADAPFKIGKSEHGAGVQFLSDIFGVFNNQQVNFSYSYKIKFKKNGNSLGLGAHLGFINVICHGDSIHLDKVSSDYHEVNDDAIPSTEVTGIGFDMGLGAQYSTLKWRVGFSALHLNNPKIKLGENVDMRVKPFFMVNGGYDFATKNPNLGFRANLLVATDLTSWTFHASLLADIKEKYWVGLGYRLQDAVSFSFGLKIFEGFKMGYTFDLPNNKFIAKSIGSHEIFASYEFALVREKSKSYKSIRIL